MSISLSTTDDQHASAEPPSVARAHPLGPVVYQLRAVAPWRARCVAAVVLVGSVALLTVAGRLTPDPAGFGSHQQLGVPPCLSIVLFGYPCPTCGMTTAFAHTVRGELLAALLAQPVGLVAALATVVAGTLAAGVLVSGRVWRINWYRVSPVWLVFGIVALMLGAWVFKIGWGVAMGTLPAGAF